MGPDELSGFELADYEESIQSAITASLKGSGGDLMPYFSKQRNPGVKAKVLSAIPSVELRDGELMGCTTVRLKEPLNDVEMKALQEYLRGQFSDGWGEGFEQWEIYTEDGYPLFREPSHSSITGKANQQAGAGNVRLSQDRSARR